MNAHEAQERLAAIYYPVMKPGQAVEEAVSIYLELGAAIEELEAARAAAKQVIADVIIETGLDRFDVNSGLAYVSRPGKRTAWDSKGLDTLIDSRPDLAGVLAPYRSEKEVAGGLVIRAKGSSK